MHDTSEFPAEQPGAARAAGLRRLSRLTWRATQLSAVTAVGFATLFARTAPAQTAASDTAAAPAATASPPAASPAASSAGKTRPRRARVTPSASARGTAGPAPQASPQPTARASRTATAAPSKSAALSAARHDPGGGPAELRPGPGANRVQRVARGRLMPAAAPAIAARTFPALGTFATVLVADPDALGPAHDLLAAELAAIDAACSRFRRDSELCQVNRAAGRLVPVSPLLAEAVAVALDAAELTGGDVDPTCGLSLARLGYDRDFALARRRTSPLRRPPMPAGGWRRVELDPDRPAVRIPAGCALDLGATAKALAADRAAAAIAAATGGGVLVNLGGDIRVAGDPPDCDRQAKGWRVGIADDAGFDASTASVEPRQFVVINDGGLATSSSLGRTWRRGGTDLHHIIDPSTGRPVSSCWRTVSVAAARCVDANIASTAAILRGERAVRWLAELRLPARLVRHDGTVVTVAGWPHGDAGTARSEDRTR